MLALPNANVRLTLCRVGCFPIPRSEYAITDRSSSLMHLPDYCTCSRTCQPAILGIGYMESFYPEPMMKTIGWDMPYYPMEALIHENGWDGSCQEARE
uniref:Uncharacterized protein n=1 Tax=Candidatus Kentrum sp. TUN TaxID=2126343 RepID=A0A450ZIT6_9GAMM|nr:MAG: hypothetical protein BECKTUN1418F_GA0071002_102712 [Candidatus Kentron sp. TUN]VFK54074.1 MAG: hypothetical protein BECKTUN1418D_GA0071000_101911 [Candidatus Kentron sp. TUN]VFK55273.1 MAG: hypothetical protein BECKTUN1418E_GA0071001_102712 [Candidatus Kentron sp. TUN]